MADVLVCEHTGLYSPVLQAFEQQRVSKASEHESVQLALQKPDAELLAVDAAGHLQKHAVSCLSPRWERGTVQGLLLEVVGQPLPQLCLLPKRPHASDRKCMSGGINFAVRSARRGLSPRPMLTCNRADIDAECDLSLSHGASISIANLISGTAAKL